MSLSKFMRSRMSAIDRALDGFIPKASAKPATIHKAMRYSLFAGGKRLRPILALASAELCGGSASDALPAACAVECIHTYSLIHDDLPCMDDDDLRRGRPTSHKVFGEGVAVLAGDALLTIAFEIISRSKGSKRYAASQMVRELADAAGSRWLIAGQVMDLEGEGAVVSKSALRFIHQAKTAALLTSALRLGAMSANATPSKLRAITDFGQALGLAFQVIDDILDVTQTTERLGKTAGKDVAATKATYPALFGLKRAREVAHELTKKATAALKPFGRRGDIMREISNSLLSREY